MSQDEIPRGAPGRVPNAPQPVPAGELRNGMLVFFDAVKKTAHRKGLKMQFRNGQGFGILLGVLPQFGKEPTRHQLVALMGSVGFVLLDDVADFLGDEQAQIFTDKFLAKYEEKQSAEPSIQMPEPSGLLGADGHPLAPPEREAMPIAAVPDLAPEQTT